MYQTPTIKTGPWSLGSHGIQWNPHKGGCTLHGGAESPALLLMHEMIHLDLRQRGLDSKNEEVTTQILNQIAGQLGEPARADYHDSAYSKTAWPAPIPSGPLAGRN